MKTWGWGPKNVYVARFAYSLNLTELVEWSTGAIFGPTWINYGVHMCRTNFLLSSMGGMHRYAIVFSNAYSNIRPRAIIRGPLVSISSIWQVPLQKIKFSCYRLNESERNKFKLISIDWFIAFYCHGARKAKRDNRSRKHAIKFIEISGE